MVNVTCDISEVLELERSVRAAHDRIPGAMLGAVRLGAEAAKRDREYTDRSGDLTKETKGSTVRSTRNEQVVELIANTPYASHVRKKGLMAIDEAAREVEAEIEERLERIVADGVK